LLHVSQLWGVSKPQDSPDCLNRFIIAARVVFSYPNSMEVHFTPEQQAQIAQIASKAGTVPERLVTNLVVRYLGEEARFLAAVEKGIAAAERGDFIEEKEMDARLEAMFRP
jgi:predicted transcriptional regulator